MRGVASLHSNSSSKSSQNRLSLKTMSRRSTLSKLDSPSPPKKMTDQMIERDFEDLLFSLGIAQASREQMRRDLSIKQKYAFVLQNQEKQKDSKKSSGKISLSVEFFVASLSQQNLDVQVLRDLAVCLNSEPMEWLEKFVAQNGPNLVYGMVTKVEKEQRDQTMLRELVRCAISLLKSKKAPKDALQRLILCLDPKSSDASSRVMILDYLAFLVTSRPECYDELQVRMFFSRSCVLNLHRHVASIFAFASTSPCCILRLLCPFGTRL